jgi:hypothetical protein
LAEYSPRLWPAANAGANPRDAGSAHRENRRLRVLGQRQLVVGAFEDDATQRIAERRVGLVERFAADRISIRERPAHADFLRALSWKDEGDHW